MTRSAARRPDTATYRLQMRGGVDFDAAIRWLPWLGELGISHLYLSPVFTAQTGSTHGYDVTRPDEIDPALGGLDGFERLARAAAGAGIGLVLDIVPNHTALSFENPWLRDVLRHGAASRYAGHFDINHARPFALCMLAAPLPVLLETETAHLADEADGPVLRVAGLSVPLDPGSVTGLAAGPLAATETLRLISAQCWRLVDWRVERDAISHRRFFSVTSLIGMRVEDREVFEAMHALVFDLVDRGLVAGLRIDHVDGLADPVVYLDRLAARLPDCPVWVEKILSGDETLDPGWLVSGTTGYEAGRAIAAVLGDAQGVARLTARWREVTGAAGDFHAALRRAKPELLTGELAAELHQLVALGAAALEEEAMCEAGPESLREAVMALLCQMPRYRTYFSDRAPAPSDLALWAGVAERAAGSLRDPRVVHALDRLIGNGAGAAAARLRVRFQQVSGALIAKSLEDTAGFRHTPYLAVNEVGAEPDEQVMTPEAFAAFCRDRARDWPLALNLTSSHDTKRSEDARMRLVAVGHLPEAFIALQAGIAARPDAAGIAPATLWYLAQSAVAIWDPEGRDLGDRLAAHMQKALREAKETTFWTAPVPAVETPVMALARGLMADWSASSPPELSALIARGEALSLCQLALKLAMPGLPDIYRGTEALVFELTDPDNRRAVDPDGLSGIAAAGGVSAAKLALMRRLLALRAQRPGLFAGAEARMTREGAALLFTRGGPGGEITLRLDPAAAAERAVDVLIA